MTDAQIVCSKCGHPHDRCAGHKKRVIPLIPCAGWPVRGQRVCYMHGGAAPRARANGERRLAQQEAEKLLISALADAHPMSSVGEVYDELLAVAGVTRSWRQILQERVAALEQLDEWSGLDGKQVAVDVQLFERALERSAKVAETIARLNLDERKAALDERAAVAVAQAITAILADLELTPAQQERAREIAPKRLRELTA